jgi:membrane protein required for colicin V production
MEFALFNVFDYTLIVIVFLSVLVGLTRGFVREIVALLTWIAALTIAILFAQELAVYIKPYIKTEFAALMVSFGFLFLATFVIGALLNYFIFDVFSQAGNVMITNHLLGGLFGFVRGLILAFLVIFLFYNTTLKEEKWFTEAKLPSYFATTLNWSKEHVQQAITDLKKVGQSSVDKLKTEQTVTKPVIEKEEIIHS